MQFSVIYSVDCPADCDALDYAPPRVDELWDQTEGDEQYGLSYLDGCWENGHHRKWCALHDQEQFDEFVTHCGLTADSTETMGSLGAPGFGFGWSPAISFESSDADALLNAYVTPIRETNKKRANEHDWKRVKDAVLAMYG
jgi:hypothetical protein